MRSSIGNNAPCDLEREMLPEEAYFSVQETLTSLKTSHFSCSRNGRQFKRARDPFLLMAGLRCGPFWKVREHGGPVLGTCFDLNRAAVQRCNLPNKR